MLDRPGGGKLARSLAGVRKCRDRPEATAKLKTVLPSLPNACLMIRISAGVAANQASSGRPNVVPNAAA